MDKTRILLVDDFDSAREMYAMCLQAAGYEPIEAASGEEAIDLAQSAQPQLIVLDVGLPGIDGWETAERLKKNGATKAIPIIALTAHAMRDERERSRKAGCIGFIAKPCLPPDLLAEVARVLNIAN